MRISPRKAVVPMSFTYCLLTLIGVYLSSIDKPFTVALLFLVTGALIAPPIPALVRAIWTKLACNSETNRALHALDSITEELVFAISPLVTSLIWSTIGAFWTIPVGLTCGFLGNVAIILLASRKKSQSRELVVHPHRTTGDEISKTGNISRSIYLKKTTAGLLLPMFGLGIAMGGISVVLPKWAETNLGTPSASGIILSIISFAGFIAGIFFGKIKNDFIASRFQYQIASLLVASGVVVFSFGNSSVSALFAATMIGAGMTPMFIVSFIMIGEFYNEIHHTEMNAAVGSSFTVGDGAASFCAGLLITYCGMHLTFFLMVLSVSIFCFGSFLIQKSQQIS